MKNIKPLLLLMSATAAVAADPTLDQLQSAVNSMQKTIADLQQQISDLKRQQGAVQTTTNMLGSVEFILPRIQKEPEPSQVKPRETLQDQQEAAPRPGGVMLDPKFKGFIPIPNTPAFVKFNAKVKLDTVVDDKNSGNPDRFVPAQIPVEGDPAHGGGIRSGMNARGSSLSVDVRAPDMPGDLRFYYNNDFYGGGTGAGMGYRLKHLYGQFFNVTAGFTYSIFEDPDVWPDTVDFEGPNSMIFARQPTVRYLMPIAEHWQVNFGIQAPSSEVDNFGLGDVSSANRAPDGGANVRWENKDFGHVQFAAILRDVGMASATLSDQHVFGWGLMAAAGINVFEKDSIQAQVTYGEGYFHFANDNFTYAGFNGGDAAFDSAGELQALPYFSAMLGYTHHWSEKFRSTGTLGYIDLDNEFSQGPMAYNKTYYASVNVIYQLRKRLSIGLEGLYGKKEVKNGDEGDVFRFQLGFGISLFD